jgi:hypothetical protein
MRHRTIRTDTVASPKAAIPVLIVLTLLLSVSACSQGFKQTEIPPEDIPSEIRKAAEHKPAIRVDPVWRAYYRHEGYDMAVASYRRIDPGSHQTWEWFVFRDGQQVRLQDTYLTLMAQAPPPIEDYGWRCLPILPFEQVKSGDISYAIAAHGWAFDRAAYRVVGTTTQGSFFEGQIVNGFWILLDLEVEGLDRFETVVVQDKQEQVLHTYQRTN